jgi:Flp pilus assembly protein TadG
MARKLRALTKDRRGSAAIEFALIGTTLLFFLVGGYEATSIVRAMMKTSSAAQTMADLVAQQTNITTTEMTDFCNGSKFAMEPLTGASLKIAVASVTKNATTGTTAVDWHDETCGSATSISGTAIALASGLVPNNGDSVIVAYATYAYTSNSSLLMPASFSLNQVSFGRPRNNTTITHS